MPGPRGRQNPSRTIGRRSSGPPSNSNPSSSQPEIENPSGMQSVDQNSVPNPESRVGNFIKVLDSLMQGVKTFLPPVQMSTFSSALASHLNDLNGESGLVPGPGPAQRLKTEDKEPSRHYDLMSAAGLTVPMIRRIICLIVQFETNFKKEQALGNLNITPTLNDFQSESVAPIAEYEGSAVAAITRPILDTFLAAFCQYFEALPSAKTNRETPLRNRLVLPIILNNLPMSDLRSCRLVNKFWNRVSTPLVRNRHSHVILLPATIPAFCELMEKAEAFPLRRFELNLDHAHFLDYFLIFHKFGTFVKDLKLPCAEDGDDEWSNDGIETRLSAQYKSMLKFIFKYASNLETLEIGPLPESFAGQASFGFDSYKLPNVKRLTIRSDESNSAPTVYYQELLATMPNLEMLELDWESFSETEDFSGVSLALKNLGKLRNLTVTNSMPATFWKALGKQNLQLTVLELPLYRRQDELGHPALSVFLNTTGGSVTEILKLKMSMEGLVPIHNRGVMKRLHTLDVSFGRRVTCANPVFSSFRQTGFPSLKVISACFNSLASLVGDSDSIFNTVEQIQLTYCTARDEILILPHSRTLANMSNTFPNLKIFVNTGQHLHDKHLGVLFGNFGSLEELSLSLRAANGMQDINYTLSGLVLNVSSSDMVSRVMGQKGHPEFELAVSLCIGTGSPNSGSGTPNPRQYSLRDLKKLKKLRLTYSNAGEVGAIRPTSISEIAVHLAFLRMNPLTELKLSGDIQLSETDVKYLYDYHGSVIINPSTQFIPSISA